MIKLLVFLISVVSFSSLATESICYGTTSNGRLENGVELPSKGENFVTYSTVARFAGRTYVHSTVRDIMLASYSRLNRELPTKVFKYAETGFEDGGRFRPHKTHRNGLSVDFMTPVKDKSGQSVYFPTNLFNKLGYKIEFDEAGKYEGLVIDYEAMAAHIVSLHKEALAHNVELWRVIFDPKLQPNLFKTKYGAYLKEQIQFSTKRSWVRHDEHYHVDFDIPCEM